MAGFNADLFIGLDEDAGTICKRFLGWTDERADTEVEEYRHQRREDAHSRLS